jgi:hypothetical protein
MPQMMHIRPLRELKRPTRTGCSHRHSSIFAAVRPALQQPAFLPVLFEQANQICHVESAHPSKSSENPTKRFMSSEMTRIETKFMISPFLSFA